MVKMLGVVVLAAAVVLTGCDRPPHSLTEPTMPRPGIITGLPPGVASVTGSCSGVIALTPSRFSAQGFDMSYPLLYHCGTGKFEVLGTDGALPKEGRVGDLTVQPNGYYVHSFRTVDLVRHGAYMFFDRQGKLLKRVSPPDMDSHDIIASPDSLLYMRYVP
ncbi:MAG: Arylsulfotransferase, partial [Betaproteobacteria bacterium]|nr:Arylsulfotransferase [Betaproteobacteria bacterium]